MHRISVSPSQLSPKLCLFGPTNLWSSPATCKHWSIPGKADVAEAELGCELDSKRETSHLAQCGKSLSSNKPSSYLIFFLSFIDSLLLKIEKKVLRPSPPESTDGSSHSVGRIYMSASTELCQCTFVLADAFSSNPWPLQGRLLQVRRN